MSTQKCGVVDPVAPNTVLKTIKEQGFELISILTTHHHWDHAGGNEELVECLKNSGVTVDVFGGSRSTKALTKEVKHGDQFSIGGDVKITCLSTPCHTQDHICYYAVDKEGSAVFTGDTLFLGGCGRFFEGSPIEMHHALMDVLAKLPAETKVYCGHEYTEKNLLFAQTIEPENQALAARIENCQQLRKTGKPTVPGTIAEELLTNPFMRVSQPNVMRATKTETPIDAMRILRQRKDKF